MCRVECLGSSQVYRPDGTAIRFRSRKHFALLVYLALSGPKAHKRERLVGLLWPEDGDGHARHSLSQALYALKRLLGDAVVDVRGEEVQIGPGRPAVDALEFEDHLRRGRLADAVALYKGDFLEGFWIRGARPFEEWLDRERARFSAEFRQGLRTLIREGGERGEWRAVMERSRRLIQLEPYDEHAYADLMRAMWIVGDRSGALREYDVIREVLARELESEPGNEIQELAARIRRRTAEAKRKESERKTVPAISEPPFIGRKEEYAHLVSVWQRVKQGQSAGVVLTGEPGIGKTRLAEEFLKYVATEDVLVLRGGCYPFLKGVPYTPFAEALRSESHAGSGIALLESRWQSQLAQIFPELSQALSPNVAGEGTDVSSNIRLHFEAVAQLFHHLASKRPLLFFLDNLQWADSGSQSLAFFLVQRLSGFPLLLLAATRLDSSDDWLAWPTSARPRLEAMPIPPFSRDEVGALLDGFLPSTQTDEVYVLSRGNPFLALEFCRATSDVGKAGSRDGERSTLSEKVPGWKGARGIVERRLTGLRPIDLRVLEVASVIGDPVPTTLLRACSGLADDALLAVMDRLEQTGLIMPSGEYVGFAHDLIHEAVYGRLPSVRQRILHARIAAQLDIAEKTDEVLAKQAWHYDRAGDRTSSFQRALKAAERLKERHAYDEALAVAEIATRNASTINERLHANVILGEVLARKRMYSQARIILRDVEALSREMSDAELTARVQNLQWRVEIDGSEQPLIVLAAAGEQHVDKQWFTGASPRTKADFAALLLGVAYRVGNVTAMRRAAELARSLGEGATDVYVLGRTLRVSGVFEGMLGHLSHSLDLLGRRLSLAREQQLQADELEAVMDIAFVLGLNFGNFEECRRWNELAILMSNRAGDPLLTGRCYGNWGSALIDRGCFDEAETNLKKAAEVLAPHPDLAAELGRIEGNLGELFWLTGRRSSAEAHWCRANGLAAPGQVMWLASTAGLGLCALERGDEHLAREYCAEACRALRSYTSFRKQCALPTEVENVYLLRSWLRIRSGAVDSAVNILQKAALSLREREPASYLRLLLGGASLLAECKPLKARCFGRELLESAATHGARGLERAVTGILGTLEANSVGLKC